MRNNIKEALLSMLGKDDLSVVKAAAECVSAIASIEIPLKMWDDIIPLL
jgi:hypothetical protein